MQRARAYFGAIDALNSDLERANGDGGLDREGLRADKGLLGAIDGNIRHVQATR